MFQLEPVDGSFLQSAQHRFVYPIDVPAHPDQVWEALTGRHPLEWCRMITRAAYTSERPFGVGATRESEVAWGAMKFRERFFAWDDAERRHAFFVEQCNVPLTRAFAEEYDVTPTDTGCRLTWTFAFEENPRYRLALKAGLPGIRRLLDSLASDTRNSFSRGTSSGHTGARPRA